MEFLNPIFLAGLTAGAIPLVLHLVNRRRARLLPIATLRFLRLIPARTIRRRRLEEYILLAARVLAIALLALGAAQPVWREAEAGSGATAVAVVLDDSYSMEYRVSGVTSFQKGAEAAVRVFRTLKDGDRAALLLASAPGGETLAKNSLEALMRRSGTARCGTSARGLLPAVKKALELLGEAREPNRELFLVTDLQERAIGGLADRLGESDPKIRVAVVDVGAEAPENLSVLRAEADAGMAIAGEPIRVSAVVRNRRGSGAAARIALVVGSDRVSERTITLEDEGDLAVQLSAVVDSPGAVGGRVVLEGDNLTRDDERHFVLPVASRIPVLLVNGDPSPVFHQDEVTRLRFLLAPDQFGVLNVASPFNVKVVTAPALEDEDFGPYSAVILANVPALTDAVAHRLGRFVRGGGGLLLFGGNRVDTAKWNEALGYDPELGLLPARVAPPSGPGPDEELRKVSGFAAAHPLFSGLPPAALRDLGRVHVRSALTADAAESGGAVIVTLDGDLPLLVEKQVGRGRVLLFTTSADGDWSNLSIRPIFLPLLHRSLRYAAGGGEAKDGFTLGEDVAIPPPPPGEPNPEVTDPEGTTRLLSGERDPEGFLTYRPPEIPGIYRVTGSGAGEDYFFALNVDAEEGDLARASPEELREAFPGRSFRVLRDLEEIGSSLARSREGEPLWPWFLAAALLVFLFEGIFANRIASARARRDAERGRATA